MTSRTRNSSRKPAPAPHPTPEPAESPTSPLFLQPPEDLPEPMPAATMTDSSPLPPSSSSSPNDAGDAGSVSPFGTPSTADPSQTSDKPPTQRRFTKAALRGYATKAVKYAGALVAGALTHPDSIERAAGLWQLDDDDIRDISDPVAGLVARRMPSKAGGALNPDVEDGFMLALAVAAYVGKQLQRKAELRALYADQGPQDMTEPEGVAV